MTDDPHTLALENAIRDFIASIGEDPERDGLKNTPQRFIKQLRECLSGYQDDPEKHVRIFDNDGYRDLVIIRDVTFSSLCEHHIVPFFGTIDIGYLPNEKILGLSKFARLIDTISRRLQVQERLTGQLAELLDKHLEPQLLIVKIQAKHLCMVSRGVRRINSITETIAIRGDDKTHAQYIDIFHRRTKKK